MATTGKRISDRWLRKSKVCLTVVALALVPLFAYANLLCAAGGAVETCCEAESAHHHDDSDADHHDADHSPTKDSCFCATMNAVASPQTIVKPAVTHSVRFVDLSLPAIPSVTPKRAIAAYEHGPPGIAPPLFLSTHALSSRAPPCLA
jgi:hypothetical protein